MIQKNRFFFKSQKYVGFIWYITLWNIIDVSVHFETILWRHLGEIWVETHLQSNDAFYFHISCDVVRPGPLCSVRFILCWKPYVRHRLGFPADVLYLVSISSNKEVRQTKYWVQLNKYSFKCHNNQIKAVVFRSLYPTRCDSAPISEVSP